MFLDHALLSVALTFLVTAECHYVIPDCVVSTLNSFIPTSNGNQLCNIQAELFGRNLNDSVYWAVNLKDASAGTINGLLAGDKFHLGHYDQCVDTEVATSGLQGQYCLMSLQVDMDGLMTHNPNEVMRKLQASIADQIMVRRDRFHVAVCVPSGCTHQDVEASFRAALARNDRCSEVGINVTVPAHQCATARPFRWNGPKIVFCSVLLALAVLVGFSTFLEMIGSNPNSHHGHPNKASEGSSKVGQLSQMLVPFSMLHNYRVLSQEDSNSLAMVNFTKVVFLLIIVFGHRYWTLLYVHHPVHNMEQAEKSYTNQNYAVLHSGALVNDVFLSVSGFLTAYSLLKTCGKLKGRQFVSCVWRKIYKLYPAYFFTLGFTTILLADISDGPFWSMKILPIVEECRRNWWTNVLFLNTIVNEADMCLFNSWYTATSVHLMIGLTVAVYLTCTRPRLAKSLLLGSFLLFAAILFYIIYSNDQPAVLPFTIGVLQNPAEKSMYNQRYIKSYARATPYVMGVIAANLTIHLKRKRYQMSSMVAGFWFLSSIVLGVSMCYLTFSLQLHRHTPLENAAFGTLISILFSLGGTAFYMTHINSVGFGAFDSLIRSRFIAVLSRLSFWVHLLNVPFQQMMAASSRTSGTFSVAKLIWGSCGDVIYLYSLSLILYLIVEVKNDLKHQDNTMERKNL
ncbi:hypothetical protein M8J75_011003 [Diaphorina citri]|nr:hypothetical protein M8J75_011003 [Diaphorina citri]